MARGGYRTGAGRPKGSKHNSAKNEAGFPADVVKAADKNGISPLEYMLSVMRNPEADQARRDRMAVAAAPFVHARAADRPVGKKEQEAAAAETAGTGSGWAGDLEYDGSRPN